MSDSLYPILFSSLGAVVFVCCLGGMCVRRYMVPRPMVPPVIMPVQTPHPVSPMAVPMAYPVYNAQPNVPISQAYTTYTVYEDPQPIQRPPAYNPAYVPS
jgi:hypothetical protein